VPNLSLRRPVAVLAAILFLGMSLAACSGSNANIASLPEEEEVTLSFIFGGEKKAATDEVWAEVSEHVKTKGLNVKFDIRFIPFKEFKTKIQAMAAAGDRWDLNFDSNWLSYREMASRGSYMALNELLPKYAPTLYAKYMEQGTLSSATRNGKIIGLPWTMKMSERAYVGWRSDLAEAAGIHRGPDEVKTVEDLDVLLYELKKAYPNIKVSRTPPLALYLIREEWIDLAFHGLGFYLSDPSMKVQAIEQQPFYLESAKMSKKWNDDKILSLDATIDNQSGADQWRNGKMLSTLTSHEWAYADPGFVDPAFRQQMSLMYPDKRYPNRTALANVLAINNNSNHPELVLRFLDMLETDRELYDLVLYGIEGKTYILNEETAEYPEGMQFATSNYLEWESGWAFWKPQFLRPTPTYPEGFWLREAEFASQPINVTSPVDGLFISDETIKQELVVRDQLANDLVGKVDDPEQEVERYATLQRDSGLDVIIDEVQRQIDEYLGSRNG